MIKEKNCLNKLKTHPFTLTRSNNQKTGRKMSPMRATVLLPSYNE